MTQQDTNNPFEKAILFLINTRNVNLLWSDFDLPTGESNGWVTGYVGTIMSGIGNATAFLAAKEAWEKHGFKNFFTGHGGWSFNRWSPEDGDSTVWGIRFAINLGLKDKLRTEVAEKFLLQHLTSDGGITTFILEEELRKFLRAGPDDDISGWMATHTCVTAAAAMVPSLNGRLVPWLQKHQLPDGSWDAFWWPDPEYATSLAVDALTLNNPLEYQATIKKSADYIILKLNGKFYIGTERFPKGSPFATALGLKILVLSDRDHKLEEMIDSITLWLIGQQRGDGSWEPSALLRVPPAKITDAAGFQDWDNREAMDWGTITVDQHSTFTTATVLQVLDLVRKYQNNVFYKIYIGISK